MRPHLKTTSDGTLSVEADYDNIKLFDDDDEELVMLDVSWVTDK